MSTKPKNRARFWPRRRTVHNKVSTNSHNSATIQFDLIKINSHGKKQRRNITLSEDGLSNSDGKKTKWFISSKDIYGIHKSKKPNRFSLVTFYRYRFQCENETVSDQILQGFRDLDLCLAMDPPDKPVYFIDENEEPKEKVSTKNTNSENTKHSKTKKPEIQEIKQDDREKIGPNSFEQLKLIGEGSFGKVYLVRHRDTGKFFAMKVLVKSEVFKRKQIEHTKTEQRILSSLRNPFIVTLHFSFQTKHKLYLILDYVKGGELFFHLKRAGQKRFPPILARFYIAEIVLAIEYLHKQNIIYRDLKPENVLLEPSGHIKVTDFGLSKEGILSNDGKADNGKANTFCGTAEYLAPEIITCEGHGKAVDWWSLGVLLYEMLTGNSPFFSTNRNDMFLKVIRANPEFPDYLHPDAVDLLSKLLKRDPSQRLGANGAQDIKDHPFFEDLDWDKLLKKKLQPPFKPKIEDNDPQNTECFDRDFTSKEVTQNSESLPFSIAPIFPDNMFDRFSFIRDNDNDDDSFGSDDENSDDETDNSEDEISETNEDNSNQKKNPKIN